VPASRALPSKSYRKRTNKLSRVSGHSRSRLIVVWIDTPHEIGVGRAGRELGCPTRQGRWRHWGRRRPLRPRNGALPRSRHVGGVVCILVCTVRFAADERAACALHSVSWRGSFLHLLKLPLPAARNHHWSAALDGWSTSGAVRPFSNGGKRSNEKLLRTHLDAPGRADAMRWGDDGTLRMGLTVLIRTL
jgi:hypothetical protein